MIEEEIKRLKAELAHLEEYVDIASQEQTDYGTWYKLTIVQEKLEEAIAVLEAEEDERRREV